MLDDEHRGFRLPLDVVNQLHRLLARRGVQVRQRLVKQKNLHLIDHHARKADALLLPAGKLVRRVIQMVLDVHQLGRPARNLVHLFLRRAAVFQRKGDVFRHRQADKLAVRVLQYRTDMRGKFKNAALRRVYAVNHQTAAHFARIAEGNQPVDAVAQRAFAAAGRPGNQHPLARHDIQIDVADGRLLLRPVLKAEIPEGNNRLHESPS